MLRVPPFHTLEGACNFYFVRHGESESNRDRRIQGHSDSPLSEAGRGHARAAGRWFADRHVDTILTSPLGRAAETAAIIAEGCGGPQPLVDANLIELNTGTFSGVRVGDIAKSDPALFKRFRQVSWEAVPDAERIESLERRTLAVWDRLIALTNEGKRSVVCVSHGGTLQWLIKATTGFPGHTWMPLFEISNCGIFLFQAESTLSGRSRTSLDEISVATERDASGVGVLGGAGPDDDLDAEASEPPDNVAPGTGYYGIWSIVNHVPY